LTTTSTEPSQFTLNMIQIAFIEIIFEK